MDLQQEWYLREAKVTEDGANHRPMTAENAFYQAVSTGDLDYVRQDCVEMSFVTEDGVGVLSRDLLTNYKYHFVIATAIITRCCVEAGMEMERAFRLSDFYIMKLDSLHTPKEVGYLHDQMALDFAGKMRLLSNSHKISKPIRDCVEYIYVHIQERVTLENLSEHTGLSPSHLSRLFKRETGVSISDYIREKKVEKAQELLKFCDFSLIQIASSLSFSSQSHFTQMFREFTGITPKKYRDIYKDGSVLTKKKSSSGGVRREENGSRH